MEGVDWGNSSGEHGVFSPDYVVVVNGESLVRRTGSQREAESEAGRLCRKENGRAVTVYVACSEVRAEEVPLRWLRFNRPGVL